MGRGIAARGGIAATHDPHVTVAATVASPPAPNSPAPPGAAAVYGALGPTLPYSHPSPICFSLFIPSPPQQGTGGGWRLMARLAQRGGGGGSGTAYRS